MMLKTGGMVLESLMPLPAIPDQLQTEQATLSYFGFLVHGFMLMHTTLLQSELNSKVNL